MQWVMFIIVLMSPHESAIKASEPYSSMDACFNARDEIIEEVGRPIINYQVICVPYLEDYEIGNKK